MKGFWGKTNNESFKYIFASDSFRQWPWKQKLNTLVVLLDVNKLKKGTNWPGATLLCYFCNAPLTVHAILRQRKSSYDNLIWGVCAVFSFVHYVQRFPLWSHLSGGQTQLWKPKLQKQKPPNQHESHKQVTSQRQRGATGLITDTSDSGTQVGRTQYQSKSHETDEQANTRGSRN